MVSVRHRLFDTGGSVMRQTISLGLSREHLQAYLEATGYWGTAELRRRNAYVLSPSAYVLSPRQKTQLDRLSQATFGAVCRLSGHLSKLAGEHSLTNPDAQFLSLARTGLRGLPSPAEIAGAAPPLLIVDLVQDEEGKFFIAEADAYNPRGFGYMALLDGSMPNSLKRSGRIAAVADLMRKQEVCTAAECHHRFGAGTLLWPAFEVFRAYSPGTMSRPDSRRGGMTKNSSTEAIHVFVIPETLNRSTEGREHLLDRFGGELPGVLSAGGVSRQKHSSVSCNRRTWRSSCRPVSW